MKNIFALIVSKHIPHIWSQMWCQRCDGTKISWTGLYIWISLYQYFVFSVQIRVFKSIFQIHTLYFHHWNYMLISKLYASHFISVGVDTADKKQLPFTSLKWKYNFDNISIPVHNFHWSHCQPVTKMSSICHFLPPWYSPAGMMNCSYWILANIPPADNTVITMAGASPVNTLLPHGGNITGILASGWNWSPWGWGNTLWDLSKK